jgi:hypothetical protein
METLARLEWRLQVRSGRFRFSVLGYFVLCTVAPALLFFVVRRYSLQDLGPTAYLAQTLIIQPFLTVLLAILITGARSGSESLREQWSPLSSAPLAGFGFLGRRWLALFALLLPLTFVPLVVAVGFAFAADQPVVVWRTWFDAWLVVIFPRALVISAGWLALVTITGSELLALVVGLLSLATFQALLNQGLLHFQLTLENAQEWLGIDDAFNWLRATRYFLNSERGREYHPGFAATESPYDLAASLEWFLPRFLLPAALAFGLFAIAGFFLGRTRPDLRPRRPNPRHPLRTYIKMWNDLRARHAPDAASGLGERLVMVVGLSLALGLLGLLFQRLHHFGQLAEERFEAATDFDLRPLPDFVRPTSWWIRGELHVAGRLDLKGRGGLENRGGVPVEQLAFTLNQGLRVVAMEAEGYRIEWEHLWDRLRLRLDPPLSPGQEIILRWVLAGTPSQPEFGLRNWRRATSFVLGFQQHRGGRFPRQLTDFSRGQMRNAVSGRRIDLQPGDLAPVPRYSTWALTPPKTSPGEFGQLVPEEILHFDAEVNLDLVAPKEWFLADACSHRSRHQGGRARLFGQCQIALSQLVVRGGTLELLEESSGGVALAMLPPHRTRGRALLRSLVAAARLSDRAWPGSQGLDELVVIEWPPAFTIDLTKGLRSWYSIPRVEQHGQLLSLPEGMVISSQPLKGESLVVSSLLLELLRRREFEVGQHHIFRALFRGLMIRRMGLDEEGATFSGAPWIQATARQAIMETEPFSKEVLEIRVPSVMAEVESRMGSRQLHRGIEMFLSRQGAPPGTVQELFADLEAASGVSLERMYKDYFEGRAMPTLRLEAVAATREENGRWRVQGKVRNTGSGEVMCPVVIKAEVGETKQMVTVDTESATSFDVFTDSQPLTVLLDPNKTCYRYVHRNSDVLERVFLQGSGS